LFRNQGTGSNKQKICRRPSFIQPDRIRKTLWFCLRLSNRSRPAVISHTDASAELRHLPALNVPERLASGRHHGGGAREDYTSAVVSTSHQAGSPVIDVAKSASWPPTRLTTDSATHTRSARKKPQDPCHKRHSSVFVISDSNHEYDAQGDNCKVGCYEKRMGDSSPEKGAE
jgi:hypothetical protein